MQTPEIKKTHGFGNWVDFRLQVRGRGHLLCWGPLDMCHLKAGDSGWHFVRDPAQQVFPSAYLNTKTIPVSEWCVFCLFRIADDGQIPEAQ
jgi:hypothetical protein